MVGGVTFATGSAFAQDAQGLRHALQNEASPAGAVQYGNNPSAGHYVNAGDAKIYYEVYGQGEPIVILHGGTLGSTYEMAPFIDHLSRSYKVIAISTRGHGKSEIGSAPFTLKQRATDAMAVINAVTQGPVTVLGFSDGAYSGYELASLYPERITKLIAIGAGEMRPGPGTFNLTRQAVVSLDKAYWAQQLALMPEPDRLDDFLARQNGLYNHLLASKELFSSIRCPVLVMAGERDQNAHLSTIFAAYYMIANSQLAIIPNATHTVFLENFPAVWASIEPFLKQPGISVQKPD
ncbi:alpha/beta hydrolase [Novosphingobium profundi]|uniref:alpha/beta fold hydrolase n=1 Tax=Novosphingobium profundi TaxID=1774954 RepID=UPI001BDA72A2|nr:alpha/beta hydrolase [Novosphingobium profundi]MBT0667356.1 alpha/beta hydrolase [Novosphingobium profundi]